VLAVLVRVSTTAPLTAKAAAGALVLMLGIAIGSLNPRQGRPKPRSYAAGICGL
jgi:hypothetical protein